MKQLLIFLICCASVFGLTNTWDGAANNNWSNAGNWDTTGAADRVPIAGDAVIIPTGFTAGTAVVIDAGATAVVFDTLVNEGSGTITLDTDAVTCVITCTTLGASTTNTADLLTVSGTGTVTVIGNVIGPTASSDNTIEFGSADVTIVITGNVTGGAAQSCDAISGSSQCAISVSGTITGGAADFSYGITNSSAPTTSSITAGDIAFVDGSSVPISGAWSAYSITSVTVNGTALGGTSDTTGALYNGLYN